MTEDVKTVLKRTFNRSTRASLEKRGIYLTDIERRPGLSGTLVDGMTLYVLNDGRKKTYAEIRAMAKAGAGASAPSANS